MTLVTGFPPPVQKGALLDSFVLVQGCPTPLVLASYQTSTGLSAGPCCSYARGHLSELEARRGTHCPLSAC